MTASLSVIATSSSMSSPAQSTPLPTPGGDTVIERIEVRTAGAAGNVALALAALGVQHRLFGAVGDDDAGRWILSELARLRLDKDIKIVPGKAPGFPSHLRPHTENGHS